MRKAMVVELILSLIILVMLFYFGFSFDLNQTINGWLIDTRGPVYGTLVSIFGVLFGFTITTTSLCLNLTDKKRFEPLRKERAYRDLWKYFLTAIIVLGISTLATLAALIVDSSETPNPIAYYLVAFFILLSIMCLINCVYALKLIIDVATRESIESPGDRESVGPNKYEDEPLSTMK
jgi:membrane protease YdiL (CAAX protease family)